MKTEIKPEDQLISEIDKMSLEITSAMDAERLQGRELWDHSKNNWASEIHHPCLKHLVHCRLDWNKAQFPSIESLYRFEEGHEKEWKITKMMADAGFILQKGQVRLYWEKYQLSGKIDGTLPITKNIILPQKYAHLKEIKVEVKSISPYMWDKTRTVDDLKRHPKFWINKIPSQLNLYLAHDNDPIGLIILITFGKKPRLIPMLFDPELAEHDLNRALKINEHVAAGTYPEPIPFDSTVCEMCEYNHLCSPLKSSNYSELEPGDKFILEDYLFLKEQADKFKETHAKLIGTGEKPGRFFGKNAIVDDIEISTKSSMRKKYPGIPKEVKKPYEVEYELIQTSIKKIGT